MKKIYEYDNYRTLLKDFFEEKKSAEGYTYRDFSKQAGMNSSSWLMHLIRGTKNLSERSADSVAQVLSLSKTETEYFHLLVNFTQAKSSDEKDRIYREILEFKKRLKLFLIPERFYEYYTRWYHPVIRSLISKVDFKNDYARLANRLLPPISPAQAKKSVTLLTKLGLIEQNPDGSWRQKDSVISTGDEISSLNIVNYHKQVSKLAQGAFDNTPREKRDISALTLGINRKDADLIKTKIQKFRKEIMNIARDSKNADSVFQLNFQFFPVSSGEDKDENE